MFAKKIFTLWLTGLSGAGKTTLAGAISQLLKRKGVCAQILDGDEVRKQLSPELGYSRAEREMNIKRLAYIARLLTDNGVPAIVSAISPYRDGRSRARAITCGMLEVYVKCPPEICEKRDVKGLYREARAGRINNFTSISHPYEEPLTPDLVVETDKESIAQCTERIIDLLVAKGCLSEEAVIP
ncbi:MAG: adenylyl-sulfate kinase [Desulfocucumaceae bacterium]